MGLTRLFALMQDRIALTMRPLALVCACLFGLCSTSAELFAGSEYVIVVKSLQTDDKGIIERRNGERWLIEMGVGAFSLSRYEGKKVLIDSPGLFGGVGSNLRIENQQARVWNAELLDDPTTRPVSHSSVIRGAPGSGGKQDVSFASGTVAPGLTGEASDDFGFVETVPNRFVHEPTFTKSRPGLLGKKHASAQVLFGAASVKVNPWETFDSTFVGWFAQLNAPLFQSECEEPFGLGVDAFGSLIGGEVEGERTDNRGFFIGNAGGEVFGGNLGFNIFFEADTWVRPFVQLGVGFARINAAVYDYYTHSITFGSEADAGLLFGIGAEVDVGRAIAFRTTFVPFLEGRDGFSLVNELFVNPHDRGFLRLTIAVNELDNASGVVGGIGMGFTW